MHGSLNADKDQQFVPISFVSIHAPCSVWPEWCKDPCLSLYNSLVSLASSIGTQVFPMLVKFIPQYTATTFNLSAFDLQIFHIDSYAWIVLKAGLLSCSASDRLTACLIKSKCSLVLEYMSQGIWLDPNHNTLIPVAAGLAVGNMTWDKMKNFRTMLIALCFKLRLSEIQYATKWLPLHYWAQYLHFPVKSPMYSH